MAKAEQSSWQRQRGSRATACAVDAKAIALRKLSHRPEMWRLEPPRMVLIATSGARLIALRAPRTLFSQNLSRKTARLGKRGELG